MDGAEELKRCLREIDAAEQADDYPRRNAAIYGAMGAAAAVGIRVGIRVDLGEAGWPVVYLELPTGQVSWHVPEHPTAWDGHSTAEKYGRLRDFAGSAA